MSQISPVKSADRKGNNHSKITENIIKLAMSSDIRSWGRVLKNSISQSKMNKRMGIARKGSR